LKRLICICVLLAGCTIGTSTTQRPALSRPVVGPDGTFWDVVDAADRRDNNALRLLMTARFIHEAILPRSARKDPATTEAYDTERLRLEVELKPHEATVNLLLEAYASQLRQLTDNRFVEVGRPEYDIRYRDDFDRAFGPNRATLVVKCWGKGALGTDPEPESIRVTFVQDRQSWLIDDVEPNALKGAFSR